MRTIMARTPHESSFSSSRRYLNWRNKVDDEDNDEEFVTFETSSCSSSSSAVPRDEKHDDFKFCVPKESNPAASSAPKKKFLVTAVAEFRLALSFFSYKNRSNLPAPLGTKVIGTVFGHRRGHVHIAFQDDPKSKPAFLIELSTLTCVLVKEMVSGLVRVALECDKKAERKAPRLLEEPLWRVYCNGKKCGYATRRECCAEELRVLKAIEPITMGAGVLPPHNGSGKGNIMYMRAKFERVVGCRDSEALYMMNPDLRGCPEFSIYFLRAS